MRDKRKKYCEQVQIYVNSDTHICLCMCERVSFFSQFDYIFAFNINSQIYLVRRCLFTVMKYENDNKQQLLLSGMKREQKLLLDFWSWHEKSAVGWRATDRLLLYKACILINVLIKFHTLNIKGRFFCIFLVGVRCSIKNIFLNIQQCIALSCELKESCRCNSSSTDFITSNFKLQPSNIQMAQITAQNNDCF